MPILIGLVFLLVIFIFWQNNRQTSAISEEAYATTDSSQQDSLGEDRVRFARLKSFIQANTNASVDTTSLDSQINTIIASNPDIVISVAIKDLRTGSVHNYGNQGAMTGASVTKVLTAVDYLKEVELGNKSLSTILENGYTAGYNIEQMIVVSDNDAWHALNNALTYSQMQSYAESIGLSSYYYIENLISASDVTKMLGDLYQRKLINEANTQTLLSYMERANFRHLIIPAIPEDDNVYHKAGWLHPHLNDSTIISNEEQAIALTIFTDSITSYDEARIASIMQSITSPTLETFGLN